MPYINKFRRSLLDDCAVSPETAGELNYKITTILLNYLKLKGEGYATYNEMIGVLECAKLELYRRKVSEYENEKCELNGDVYKE
jgi:hypothetical protein